MHYEHSLEMSERIVKPQLKLKHYVSVLAVGAVVLGHLGVSALWSSPQSELKQAVGMQHFQYMNPIFNQNWGVFAPNINTVSKSFMYRATLVDGTVTDWVDASALEHQLMVGRPGATRAAGISDTFIGNYTQSLDRLPPELFEVAAFTIDAPGGSEQVEKRLEEKSKTNAEYLSLERAAFTYASLASESTWGAGNVAEVQIGERNKTTVPFSMRNENVEAEVNERHLGWRNYTTTPGQNKEAFISYFARLVDRAGLSGVEDN